MVVYNGVEKVLPTMFWISGATASNAPFYFDGITNDEFLIEQYYYGMYAGASKILNYKPLRKQLIDGDIMSIPDEYKKLCPYPENCKAFTDLLNVA